MRRRTALVLLGGCVAAVIGVLVTAATDERRLAFTLSVRSTGAVVVIPPGAQACQGPIPVPTTFATVELGLGTFYRPGPQLEVEVVELGSDETLARGTLPGGYADNQKHEVALAGVPEGATMNICLRNEGRHRVGVYSGNENASYTSVATVQGEPRKHDMDLIFRREEQASLLSLVPDVFDRAALWLPEPARGWIIWVLAGLVVFLVPALLVRALAGVSA